MRSAAAVNDSLKCTLDTEDMAYSQNSIRIQPSIGQSRVQRKDFLPLPDHLSWLKTLLVSQATECPKQSKQSPSNPRVLTKFRRTDITMTCGKVL